MAIEIKDMTEQNAWDDFMARHPEANFLHAWQWGEFHLSRGKKIVRRGVYSDQDLIGVYEGVVETARRGTHLAIAGGPIIDWSNKKALSALRDDMIVQGRAHNCVFVRVRPQLEYSDKALNTFQGLGFKKAPIFLSVELAGILDLNLSEEEILAGMRQRLRRSLRKADKAGITIETTDNPASMKEFYRIQLETAGRHGFISFSESFLQKQFNAFARTGNILLYTAKHEGEILAQNFIIFYGNEAAYHYGVSTELGTKLSGAPLLHMEAMREARRRGCMRYNFWGIVDEADTKHRFYGPSAFKRGFGVQELRYVPAHDLILKPLPYKATWLLETARRIRRHV